MDQMLCASLFPLPLINYERDELLIDGDGNKKYAKKRAPSPFSLAILTASDSELRSHVL